VIDDHGDVFSGGAASVFVKKKIMAKNEFECEFVVHSRITSV